MRGSKPDIIELLKQSRKQMKEYWEETHPIRERLPKQRKGERPYFEDRITGVRTYIKLPGTFTNCYSSNSAGKGIAIEGSCKSTKIITSKQHGKKK